MHKFLLFLPFLILVFNFLLLPMRRFAADWFATDTESE